MKCSVCDSELVKFGHKVNGKRRMRCLNHCVPTRTPKGRKTWECREIDNRPNCRYCGAPLISWGKETNSSIYRWRCKSCKKTMTRPDCYEHERHPKIIVDKVLTLLSGGYSYGKVIDAISKDTGIILASATINNTWRKHKNTSLIIKRASAVPIRFVPAHYYTSKKYENHIIYPKQNNEVMASMKQPMPEFYPFITSSPNNADLIILVNNAVPRNISEDYRQDICQELLLGLLTHEFTLDELTHKIPEYIKRIYKQYQSKWVLSLDAPLHSGDDDTRTLLDTLDESKITNKW